MDYETFVAAALLSFLGSVFIAAAWARRMR